MKEVEIKFNFSGIIREEEVLDEVKRQIEQHNEQGKQNVRDLIELSLKTKTLITLVRNQHRGFGKSTVLERKAEELGATLIVPRSMKGYYNSLGTTVKCYVSPQQARGAKFDSIGFIVDEGVDLEVIKELSIRNEFLGGFSRL